MKKHSNGFTLIELLVVIAIIGILASVILAALNTSRGKGTDAAIKSTFSQLRTQMELYINNNGNYGTAGSCVVHFDDVSYSSARNGPCDVLNDQTIFAMLRDIAKKNSEAGRFVRINITTSPTATYTIFGAIKSDPDTTDSAYPGWCVDSKGRAQSYSVRRDNGAINCTRVDQPVNSCPGSGLCE